MESMTPAQFEEATGKPLEAFDRQCHAGALALVRSGALPQAARVARGVSPFGQHSWVTIGSPYDPASRVIDPTEWSWVNIEPQVKFTVAALHYIPHGSGNIWDRGWGPNGNGDFIQLDQSTLSHEAQTFLRVIGPRDAQGWSTLAKCPVDGWPSAEIISAMAEHDQLRGLVPIDVLGMLTDKNPGGLYLP